MTDRLAEIQARTNAASNGPWWYDGRDIFHKPDGSNMDQIVIPLPLTWHESQAVPDADALFVANAREDVPWLLVRVQELEAKNARLEEALERIAKQQQYTLRMIRDNGFVFDSIGTEPGNWQHLAFSIYNDLCEVDAIARAVLVSAGTPPEAGQYETSIALSSSSVNVRVGDEVPFEQFLPFAFHRGGCAKFRRDNSFDVTADCTCGLANLFGGDPCPCSSCRHHRAVSAGTPPEEAGDA